MKKLATLAFLGCMGMAHAYVVPNYTATTEGDGTFALTSTGTTGRTYQMTIASSQLAGIVGLEITGMAFRLNGPGTANWPPVDANFSFWDIYMGPGVAPGSMSNTFADNFTAAPTQVRSGALTFAAGSFTFGSTPNAFGPTIAFNTGYVYTGGNLTIEMRFSQQTGATTQSPLDAVTASGGPGNGWGVDFAARWTGNAQGTTGANGNFLVTKLEVVPEPATLTALGIGLLALLKRRRQAK
jgi:hypothetical protein